MTRFSRSMLCGLAVATLMMVGCGGGGGGQKASRGGFRADSVRRTTDRDYLNTPSFGAPRGWRFEDLVPVGARITAVHAVVDRSVNAVWLSYERGGKVTDTRRRGSDKGRVETFKLKSDEKIIGIHGYGRGHVDALTVATNRRTHTFGNPLAIKTSNQQPWFDELTRAQREQYVGVGLVGRVDTQLRQVSFRIQVQGDKIAGVQR